MIGNIINTVASKLGLALISIALLLLNSNFLGSEGLGTIGLIVLEISIYLLISNLVTGGGLVYFASRMSSSELLIISYLWMIVTAILYYTLLLFIPFIQSDYAVHVLFLGLIQSGVSTHINLLAGKEEIKQYNRITLIQAIVQVSSLCIFFFYFKETTVKSFIYSTYFAYSIAFLASLIKLIPYIENKFVVPTTKNILEVCQYGFYIQTANISQLLNYRLSYFLLDYFSGRASVGMYMAGVQLSEGVLLPSKSIGIVQYTKISNSRSLKKSAQLSIKLLKLVVILTVPFILILMLIPNSIYLQFLGDDFGQTSIVISLMSVGIVALAAEVILSRFFSGSGFQKINASCSTLGLVVTVIAGLILIPLYGIIGAAITSSLSFLSMFLYMLFKIIKIAELEHSDFYLRKSDFLFFRRVVRRYLT